MTAETAAANSGADTVDEEQKNERVKARWAMLRQALLGKDACGGAKKDNQNGSSGGRFNVHSMNSFPGFKVLDRTIFPQSSSNYIDDNLGNDIHSNDDDDNWDIVQYTYTSTKSSRHKVQFLTREAKEQQANQQQTPSTIQSRVEALLSHRTYGVDNTGNVRVWDAEGTLSGFLLSIVLDGEGKVDLHELDGNGQSIQLIELKEKIYSMLICNDARGESGGIEPTCKLLELGAGQAGLAGLALASTASSNENAKSKPLHVILTDGHPKCVDNNTVCAKMLSGNSIGNDNISQAQVEANLLLWDSSSKGADACGQINNIVKGTVTSNATVDGGQYQICLASDCVHFQDFHDGLLLTIARTLAVNGVALLCQPRRGTSLQNFMTLVDAVNDSNDDQLFEMTLFEDFYPKVSDMHTSLLLEAEEGASNKNRIYDPNWHRPLLLVLQKLRPYSEEIDGEVARQHVKTREKELITG